MPLRDGCVRHHLETGFRQHELESTAIRLGVGIMVKNVPPLSPKPLNGAVFPYLKDDLPRPGFELAALLSCEEPRESPEMPVVSDQDEALRVCDEGNDIVGGAGTGCVADAQYFVAELDQKGEHGILNVLVEEEAERRHHLLGVVRQRSSRGGAVHDRSQRRCRLR